MSSTNIAGPSDSASASGGGGGGPITLPLAISDGGTGATSAAGARANLGLGIGSNVQGWDADLDSLANLASTGVVVRTGANTYSLRSLIGTTNQVIISDGDGVGGNPILSLPQDIDVTSNPTFAGLTLTNPLPITSGGTGADNAADARTNLGVEIDVDVQAWDVDLDGLASLATTGIVARTGSGAFSTRTITGTTDQVIVADGDGVSGDPVLSLPQSIGTASTPTFGGLTLTSPLDITSGGTGANNAADARINLGIEIGADIQAWDIDLDGLAALSTTGFVVRTGSGTFTTRSLTGTTNQVNISNGDGVTAGPVLSLPQDIHTGASPTFNNITITNDIRGNRIAVGSDAVFGIAPDLTYRSLDFSHTVTDFSASFLYAPFASDITLNPSVNISSYVYGHKFDTLTAAGNSKDMPFVNGTFFGFKHQGTGTVADAYAAYFRAMNLSSGDIGSLIAFYSQAQNIDVGTIDTLYGNYVEATNTGGGTVNNNFGILINSPQGIYSVSNYGIYLDDQDVAPDSWAIYSNGGQSYFKGYVGIGREQPRTNLELSAAIGDIPKVYLSSLGIFNAFSLITDPGVFGEITALSTTIGGMQINGYSGEDIPGIMFNVYNGTDGASSNGAMAVNCYHSDGGGDVASFPSQEKMVIFRNGQSQEIFNILGGGVQVNGRLRTSKHAVPIASASSLDLGGGGNLQIISGNTTINYISTLEWDPGSIVILKFSGAPTITHNAGAVPFDYAAILLAGSVNFNATANDTLLLVYDGTNWSELARTAI